MWIILCSSLSKAYSLLFIRPDQSINYYFTYHQVSSFWKRHARQAVHCIRTPETWE